MEEQGRSKSDQPPKISDLRPVTHEAYGGGMYGTDDVKAGGERNQIKKPPASDTQSADGISERPTPPKHDPPRSSGDRDLDITGMSYIQ